MSNERHKMVRQRSWVAARARKQQRITAQRERERANLALRAAGRLTPWETACAQRSQRRLAAGLAQEWAKRQTGL